MARLSLIPFTSLLLASAPVLADSAFNRIASFDVSANLTGDRSRESSPEIIGATDDGQMLVYTDSPAEQIGFVDISDAESPKGAGTIALDGEPTSVVVVGRRAFVGVNTSTSYTDPSGYVAVFNVDSREEVARCDIGGQPDALAASPAGDLLAIAIENERDEDLNDGVIPQLPPGNMTLFPISDGRADCAGRQVVDLTGLAEIAPSDPEPEFVDINGLGETVVTLQENNHIVVVGRDGIIISHFSAGGGDLEGIDITDEDRRLTSEAAQADRRREPDAVNWIDDQHFAIANEGDYEGGSRGWTIFSKTGEVVYESATDFERAIIDIGHYPEKRSDNKGVEPESIEFGRFDGQSMVFVGAERASVVGVYRINGNGVTLEQLLPSGIGPEGILAIESRDLLITANEVDLGEDGGPRAHVMIYRYEQGTPNYPTLTSHGSDSQIGWTALSGLSASPSTAGILYAVNDSFLRNQPRIFRIDANQKPARITDAIDITRDGLPAQKLDLEGITDDGAGGFWLASEGRHDQLVPHALYHVDAEGHIQDEVAFPPELLAQARRFAAEGIARDGDTLWIAIQREWVDDPEGYVKLVAYNTESKAWGAVRYPLEAGDAGWVGLSEITIHGDHAYVLERDNQIGAAARIKRLYRIPMSELNAAPLGGDLPIVNKELVRDLLPDLLQWKGYAQDKVEGFAIDAEGVGYVITDNDGVDDHSGETLFWALPDRF